MESIKKFLKKQRTVEAISSEIIVFLSKSRFRLLEKKDVALTKIIRESITDEAFASALATVAAKMIDVFD